ncbi:MAG TPA: hypothetical protein DCE41_37765 [Cytophagales bacterium]|nr:hypothetical protein [Cytophagales bacterium]HAA22368.1 hypothetical protein [Cytophagales bacterium]HAP62191.1 hypothetical protein [Cytophagales bacterium]
MAKIPLRRKKITRKDPNAQDGEDTVKWGQKVDDLKQEEAQNQALSPPPTKGDPMPTTTPFGDELGNDGDRKAEEIKNEYESSSSDNSLLPSYNPFEPLGGDPATNDSNITGKKSHGPRTSSEDTLQTPVESVPEPKPVELVIDEDYTYFFVFGLTTAGKSAMLSGLIYYMDTARLGVLRPQGGESHQKRGRYLIKRMRDKVRSGTFIEGTQTLNAQSANLVTEINLRFEPKHPKLPPLQFCLLEMAGEDLKEVEIQESGDGGEFDDRIDAFLTHPDVELMFICVVDTDFPQRSEDAIRDFMDHLYDKGHQENPLLLTVNKWDKVSEEYGDDIERYLRENLPSVMNSLEDQQREHIAYLDYSIGEVNVTENTFAYKDKDSKRLFKWIYKAASGVDFIFDGEEGNNSKIPRKKLNPTKPWWQKLSKRFEDE